jgi:hypothetical protein
MDTRIMLPTLITRSSLFHDLLQTAWVITSTGIAMGKLLFGKLDLRTDSI